MNTTFFYQILDDVPKIKSARDALMNCDTSGKVRNIIRDNIGLFVKYPDLLRFAEKAFDRIRTIQDEKLRSYKSILN